MGNSNNVYQIVTEKIIDLLEQGVVPWKKPWRGGKAGMPKNLVSKKAYAGKLPAVYEALVSDIRELKRNEKEKVVTTGGLFYHQVRQTFYQKTHNYSRITKGFQTTILVQRLQESSHSLNDEFFKHDYKASFIIRCFSCYCFKRRLHGAIYYVLKIAG